MDLESGWRHPSRRRVVVAVAATVGAAFIAAGLLAGPAFLPGIRDQIRDRNLAPVQIAGEGGFRPAGGAAPSGAGRTGPDGMNDSEKMASEVPDILLPSGQSLREIVAGSPAPGATDGATGLVDDTVGGLNDVLGDPTSAPQFVQDTVSTLPLPALPIPVPTIPTIPTIPTLPTLPTIPTIPTVPTIPTTPTVTTPPVTAPPVTVPVTVPGISGTPPVTLPVTIPGVSVPAPPSGGLL